MFRKIISVYYDLRSRKLSRKQTVTLASGLGFVLLFLTGGLYYTITIFTRADTCFTVQQVQSDSRCLYIYNNQVYEKGTRAAPHHDNPCGSDVTAILPNNHLIDKVGRLDPNYKGNICVNQPVPTTQPTTPPPTNTPAPQPTEIPPTQPPSQQNSAQPTATRTPSPTSVVSQGSVEEMPTDTPRPQADASISPTISTLPVSGAKEDVITAVSAGLLLFGALGLVF